METEKIIFIAIWTFALIGGFLNLIKKYGIYRRKQELEFNLSESIFISSMILSAGIIQFACIGSINKLFDVLYKTSPNEFYFNLIKNACGISFIGIILGVVFSITAYFLTSIFFAKRNQLLEFENNNIQYSLVRSIILIVLLIAFYSSIVSVFELLVPNDVLLYR